MATKIAPSQLNLHTKPELAFIDQIGLNSAEYVFGALICYCRDKNRDSFTGIPTAQFFTFLMNYQKSEVSKAAKLKGLFWLFDKQVLVSQRSQIIFPTRTLDFIQKFSD